MSAPDLAHERPLAEALAETPFWSHVVRLRGRDLDPGAVCDALSAQMAKPPGPDQPVWLHGYLNFPLCKTKCSFCMYPVAVGTTSAADRYAEQLAWEIDWFGGRLGPLPVQNVYAGGGTPSMPSAAALEEVYSRFAKYFRPKHGFTAECNPDSTDEAKLAVLARHGVNRISFGVQSLDRGVLKKIRRAYQSAERIRELIAAAQKLGLVVSCDLVYGLAGDTTDSFRATLETLTEFGPDNIHVYFCDPVDGHTPNAELLASKVMWPNILYALRKGAGRGYIPIPTGQNGVILTGPRQAGAVLGRIFGRWLPSAARYWLLGDPTPPLPYFYPAMHDTYSSLLGIGSRAFGHVYGHTWYSDISPLPDAQGRIITRPRLWGADSSPREEFRWHALERFRHALPLWNTETRRRFGSTVAESFPAELAALRERGFLREWPLGLLSGPFDEEKLKELTRVWVENADWYAEKPERALIPDPLSTRVQKRGLSVTPEEEKLGPAEVVARFLLDELLQPFSPHVPEPEFEGWSWTDTEVDTERIYVHFERPAEAVEADAPTGTTTLQTPADRATRLTLQIRVLPAGGAAQLSEAELAWIALTPADQAKGFRRSGNLIFAYEGELLAPQADRFFRQLVEQIVKNRKRLATARDAGQSAALPRSDSRLPPPVAQAAAVVPVEWVDRVG